MFTPSLPFLSKSLLRTILAGVGTMMVVGFFAVPQAWAATQRWTLDNMANFSYSNPAYFEQYSMPASFNLKPFQFEPSLNGANSVAVSGNYAYATAYQDDGLEVMDISDPTQPFHVSSLVDDVSMLLDNPRDIKIIGNYAYVTSMSEDGIQVFDISDPYNVVPTVSISDDSSTALDGASMIEVVGNYAYVTGASDDGVQILDVTIPSAPVPVAAFFNNSSVRLDGAVGITAEAGKLYITAVSDNALQIFDISVPTVLTPLGYVVDDVASSLSMPYDVEVIGDYAYVASYNESALSVVDVSVPATPFELTALLNGPSTPLIMAKNISSSSDGLRLYVDGVNNSTLLVLDISTPGDPVVHSLYDIGPTQPQGIEVVGTTLYVALSSGDSVEILDASDSTNLSRTGFVGDSVIYGYPTIAPAYGVHPGAVVAEIPWVMPNVGQPYTTFTNFSQAHWGSDVYYQFSPDDGVTWYYYDNSTLSWVVAASNSLATMTPSVSAQNYDSVFGTQFPSGTFKWRAFYSSDGTNSLRLGWAEIDYENTLPPPPPSPPAASDACPNWGNVNGLSSYVIPNVSNSGRADYDRAAWAIDPFNINSAPPSRGLPIGASDKLCFDSLGNVEQGNRWMWNNNFGWIDFEWCDESALPGCTAYEPFVDFDNPTSYGAPWGGKVWNDNIGWIDLDWCFTSGLAGCEEYEVHTILPNPWPTALTNAVGPVRGYGWNNLVGWIPFGDLTGAVTQELPSGGTASLVVQPVVSISPDPALVTKYGGTTGVIAPLADAEDPYIIHVDFEILDAAGLPTGTYLNPFNYDVAISETLVGGSNFGALKVNDALTTGVDAVFWDSMVGDPEILTGEEDWYVSTSSGNGFDWYISSFAPTSSLNGQEDANGLITKYFDVDSNLDPLPSRDFYTIQDLDFTITPLNVADPPASIQVGWSLTGTWDLKFRPLIEITNMAFSQVSSVSSPFYNFFPTTPLDTDFYIRGIVMNWNASSSVETNDVSYTNSTTGISGASWSGLPLEDGFKVDYDLSTDLTPAFPGSALVFSAGGSNTSKPFYGADTNTASSLIALGAAFSSQYVPTGISAGRELNNPGASSFVAADVETVNLSSSALGVGVTLNEALYSTTISYAIIDPLDTSRSILVAYDSNRLTSTPALSSTPSPLPNYLPLDPDPGEYLDTSSGGPGTIGSWGSVTPPTLNIGLMENALIVGSVTGSTANQTIVPGDDIVLLGDITTFRTRNALFQRFSKLKKGVTATMNSVTLTADLEISSSAAGGAELLGGDILYFTEDVTLPSVINSGYDQKTIVVEGADVYLEGNLDGSNTIGLVVFKDFQGNGGNVYIDYRVKELSKLNIFADGSVMSTDRVSPNGAAPTWQSIASRQQALTKQLYIGGSLITKNTIGGVRSNPQLLPSGVTAQHTFEAATYDLNHLREFQVCWYAVQADPLSPSQPATPFTVLNAAGTPWTGPALPGPSYFVDCPSIQGYERSPQIPSSSNEPVRIEYIPPPPSLPLLGETQSSGFTVF